jgi:hypothetical protein
VVLEWSFTVHYPKQPSTISRGLNRGGTIGNLKNALQELRAERKQAQLQVEKLDQAILAIELLNGSGKQVNRRESYRHRHGGKWRRHKRRGGQGPGSNCSHWNQRKQRALAPVKRAMSVADRRKTAAFQRARWAKIKRQKKAA